MPEKQSKEELEKMAGKVLFPNPVDYKFAGLKLGLVPLPIFYARQVSDIMIPENKKIMDFQEDVKKGEVSPQEIMNRTMDAAFVDAIMRATSTVLKFYQEKYPSDELKRFIEYVDLSKEASLAQMIDLLEKQVEVNNYHDFLLQPLSVAILLVKSTGVAGEAYRRLQSMGATARDGELDFTNSLESTQKDSLPSLGTDQP